MKKKKNFVVYFSIIAIALILGFGNSLMENNINNTVTATSDDKQEKNKEEYNSNQLDENTINTINEESNSNEVKSNTSKNDDVLPDYNDTDEKYTTEVEYTTKMQDYKYGIKIEHAIKETYYIYANGKKELHSSMEDKSKIKYDYSGYNADAKTLTPEAKENIENNKSLILEEINHVNKYRKEAGLQPLEYDESLALHANIKVLDMYYGNYFSHDSRNGEAYGYLGKQIGVYPDAENIAKGYNSASAVTINWYNSEDYKANILNPSYTKIGVGYKNGYWVQNFK